MFGKQCAGENYIRQGRIIRLVSSQVASDRARTPLRPRLGRARLGPRRPTSGRHKTPSASSRVYLFCTPPFLLRLETPLASPRCIDRKGQVSRFGLSGLQMKCRTWRHLTRTTMQRQTSGRLDPNKSAWQQRRRPLKRILITCSLNAASSGNKLGFGLGQFAVAATCSTRKSLVARLTSWEPSSSPLTACISKHTNPWRLYTLASLEQETAFTYRSLTPEFGPALELRGQLANPAAKSTN